MIVNQEGKVESIKRIDGHPLLIQAAIDAVKQWVYKLTAIAGNPVKVQTQQTEANFRKGVILDESIRAMSRRA